MEKKIFFSTYFKNFLTHGTKNKSTDVFTFSHESKEFLNIILKKNVLYFSIILHCEIGENHD